jgi:nicotinamide-nucleotide amidase
MASKSLIEELSVADAFIATAESITGGLVAAHLTDESGSSGIFLGGVVAYQNQVKQELLGVSPSLMEQQGAVDAEVAAQMAIGVRQRFARINQVELEKVIGVSTTGVAGPGLQEGKEPGTVFIGVSSRISDVVYSFEFLGDRGSVREQSVAAVVNAIREQLQLLGG